MALSPWTSTLASGARASEVTETYDVSTRGRKGLVLVSDVTAIGNGHSYVIGGAVTLPLVVDATHNNFTYDGNVYTIADGSYATTAALATAIGAATSGAASPFSTVVTVTAEDADQLRFTSVATGVNAKDFDAGDGLVGIGLTAASKINDTGAAGADGAFSQTISVLGVDEASGKTWTILDAAAQSTVSTKILQVQPAMAAVTNLVANSQLPATVRVSITHTTTNEVTRTLGIQLVA